MKIGCVLLAAGGSFRFGGNKLLAKLNGKPVLEYALLALPKEKFSSCVIIAANEKILDIAEKYGVSGVINDQPKLGISLSIKMGIELMENVDACMFFVCDQPMLKRETISTMLDSYQSGTIFALSCNKIRGNPVVFPGFLMSELSMLKKGESGTLVIDKHTDILRLYDIDDAEQLDDIDTQSDLASIVKL